MRISFQHQVPTASRNTPFREVPQPPFDPGNIWMDLASFWSHFLGWGWEYTIQVGGFKLLQQHVLEIVFPLSAASLAGWAAMWHSCSPSRNWRLGGSTFETSWGWAEILWHLVQSYKHHIFGMNIYLPAVLMLGQGFDPSKRCCSATSAAAVAMFSQH